MKPLIILLIIIFAIIAFSAYEGKLFSSKKESKSYPYRKKDYLLSIAEKNFYDVLKEVAAKKDLLLFAKVRLEDLLWIPKGVTSKERFALRQRIKSRHVDFLLCDKVKIRPLLVVELDDSSHSKENVKKRDSFVDMALGSAGLSILRVRAGQSYGLIEISGLVDGFLDQRNKLSENIN
jgi:very-short-patch-repair endonuclease